MERAPGNIAPFNYSVSFIVGDVIIIRVCKLGYLKIVMQKEDTAA
jgi:hypothetical protein